MKKSSDKTRKSRAKSSGKAESRDAGHGQDRISKKPERDDPDKKETTEMKDAAGEDTDSYKPLSSYLHDKEMLIDQLFTSIRDADLSDVTPKILKGYSTDQLKKICLKELKGMSDGLIMHILQGDDMRSYKEGKSKEKSSKEEERTEEFGASSNADKKRKLAELPKIADIKRCARDMTPSDATGSTPEQDVLELYPTAREMARVAEKCQKETLPECKDEGRDLELLELEMRARAIRSLLRARGVPSSEDEDETATST